MRYTKPKYIQLIHIAKSKLGLDDESYRAMLVRLTGKNSTKEMNTKALDEVLKELEQKGFALTASRFTRSKSSPKSRDAWVKSRIALKIRAKWIEMARAGIVRDGSEQALNAFVRNTVNPKLARQKSPLILNVASLDDHLASAVLEILKKWQQRGTK